MSIALVVVARDEAGRIERALESARFVDRALVVDTGSEDDTRELAAAAGAEVTERPWVNFAHNRTEALRLAKDSADWLLMLDADMTVEAHPDLREWLAADPDPEVDAWQVEIVEADIRYRLPLLTRAGVDVRYEGVTHEALVGGRKHRPLLGLTITHHADGANRASKHERDIELLADGVAQGDPRAVYYTAQALKCLGRVEESAYMYERRAEMGGWEEERWHARYMAARLRKDIQGLIYAHGERPWRPEPLQWAARLVRQQGSNGDVLFLEQAA